VASRDPLLEPRHLRRTALLGATLVVPFAFLDLTQGGPPAHLAVALAARLAWSLCLLAGAALLAPPRPRPRTAATLMSAGTVGASLVIVAATGGTQSGYFAFLLSLPFCMAVLLPGHLLPAMASGAVGVAGGALLLAGAGAAPIEIARWVGTGGAASILAVYATHLGGRLLRRELDAARSRAEAAAALATSERRRAATERLALVGRLAAGVAHEVNNPLGFVKANLDFVRSQLPPGARSTLWSEVDEALQDADLGVERIRRIVEDLRSFARDDADEPCGADAAGALAEALRLASVRTRGLSVRTEVAPGLPPVRICHKRLVQVAVNLLVNAADAVLDADDPGHRWIEVAASAEDGDVTIRVEDGGAGLSDAALGRLFEPFFTTKPPGAGTGLGLALSNEYVSAVGGGLTAWNGERGGAVFEVRLPRQSSAPGCGACTRECPDATLRRAANG
jgi:signal transduction histidine kinase